MDEEVDMMEADEADRIISAPGTQFTTQFTTQCTTQFTALLVQKYQY